MSRPAHQNVLRTPSGQKSRSKEADKQADKLTLEIATWRRRRDNPGITVEEARSPQYGSVIERWYRDWESLRKKFPDKALEDMFSQLHRDAAERYHGLYLRWLNVINAKSPRSASDFSGSGGFDGADPFEEHRAKRDADIEADFKEARRAILESGPLGMMAIEAIVIENQPVVNLRGDLRLALNALARLWKMME